MHMNKAYQKDIWRTIKKSKKRFISIMIITMLGVTMLTGLKAGCVDLRNSADSFYDQQNLFDIQVVSTLGLDDHDIEALQKINGIRQIEGSYEETVYLNEKGIQQSIALKALSTQGMNSPYVIEGTLPSKDNEIAVSEKYQKNTKVKLYDTITLHAESDSHLKQKKFKITAIVQDAMDISMSDGLVAFRSTSTANDTFFVHAKAFDNKIYTSIYITLRTTKDLMSYSDEYNEQVKSVISEIESKVKTQREQARYDEIVKEAKTEYTNGKYKAEDAFAKADMQLKNAKIELLDGKSQLQKGWDEVVKNQTLLTENKSKANAEIAEKEQEWTISQQHLTESYRALQQNQDILSNSLLLLNQQQDYANRQFVEADEELKKGKQTQQANEEKLKQGEQNLQKQLKSYEQSKTKTQKELTKAYKAIEQIDMTKWYVQDRNALNSYTSVQSDASSIETVGNAFPIVFLIVAILISLTTITRMVEEERGLIGTYKALGFSDISIYGKYLIYAFSACMIGGILGDICGFILLPKFLFTIFQVLYQLPVYEISFNYVYGIGGVLLFVVGIVSATIIACRVELTQMPAILMRPKAPRAGSRMILEHIPSLWKKLSFLNKVTMRNLFRFKKRMFMTIGGIMGCTALILCGFAIKDSVTELMPGQYERIYKYDFMAVVAENRYHDMEQELKQDSQISDYTGVRIDSVKVKTNKNEQEETMQLMVIPNQEFITRYIGLEDTSGKSLALKDGIYITQNASQVLGFKQGDDIYIQDSNLIQQKVQVNKLVQNYLGNTVYMTQHTYEQLFQPYKANGFLAHFLKTCPNQIQYADDFRDKDDVLSSISVQFLKEQFSEAFSLINAVVYLITIMAAGLAFVVLFTLSTTNISERERELATIKVLGFFDNEVHLYVNKETVILTLLGILCGLPLGRVLSGMLTSALNMPSIHFAVSVYPMSYVYAALLSLCFACIVNLITNRTLNRINMVEALKSIE